MNFKIPTHFMGRQVDGAMERLLKANPAPQPQPAVQTPTNAPNLNEYIYVPSIKLYVAKERTLTNLNWNQAQEELKKQKLAMPTPYQFREFLKYLRDSKNKKHQELFGDITEVRAPYRANWINARFEDRNGEMHMISENVLENGRYKTVEQKLADFLGSDKTPGISLDAWLNSNMPHGLPPAKIKKGSLYYWNPETDCVARFCAGSDWAFLCCERGPSYAGSSLGVFACAEGAVAKNRS